MQLPLGKTKLVITAFAMVLVLALLVMGKATTEPQAQAQPATETPTGKPEEDLEKPQQASVQPIQPQPTPATATEIQKKSDELALLVVEYRKEMGLPPLARDAALERAAFAKAEHLTAKEAFYHRDSLGRYGVEEFANAEGYRIHDYRLLGENLACGWNTAQEVLTAWVNSEKHRNNILHPSFTEYGVGFFGGNVNYFTCNNENDIVLVMFFGGLNGQP